MAGAAADGGLAAAAALGANAGGGDHIDDLRARQRALAAEKKRIASDLKLEKRKRQRLMHKAKALTNAELGQVLEARAQAMAKAAAKAKAKAIPKAKAKAKAAAAPAAPGGGGDGDDDDDEAAPEGAEEAEDGASEEEGEGAL